MTLLRKAGSGSVDPVIFNDVVDAEQNGSGGLVTAADIDSQAASNGDVLTANGAGGATFAASPAPSFATPAVALGASAVAGSAGTVIRSDSTIVAFDSTAPTTQAFADAASVGTAAVAARRDHKHAMMAAPTTVSGNAGTATKLAATKNIDGQAFDGSADITVIAPGTHAATSKTTPADADELPLVDSAASNVLKKLTWTNLKATIKAYTDTLYPSGSGTSTGTNTGDQTVPSFATNAVVLGTAAAAGAASTVMRSNDTIAAFDATSPTTQAFGDAAAVGTAAFAARRDHKHAMMANPVGISWTTVTKASDESVISSTALQNDDELLFTAASGGLYEFELFLVIVSPAGVSAGNWKFAFGESGTSTGALFVMGIGTAGTQGNSQGTVRTTAVVAMQTIATNRPVFITGCLVSAGGSTQNLQWAQNVSDANNVTVKAGSTLRYRRIL